MSTPNAAERLTSPPPIDPQKQISPDADEFVSVKSGVPLTALEAEAQWPKYRPLIVDAVKHCAGLETIQDVEDRLYRGQYQAWYGERSAVITEFSHFARAKTLTVMHAGGDLNELLTFEPVIADYARSQGCQMVMGHGRQGWQRIFAPHGYRMAWIVMVKDLPTQGR